MKIIKIVLPGILGIIGCFLLINSVFSSSSTTSAGSAVIVNEERVIHPFSMPGDTITVRKILNTGVLSLESNSPLIKTGSDLFNLEQNERAAKKQIYGVMSDGLINKLGQIGDNDTIKAKIILKIQPLTPPLDKTKYSMDVLMAQEKNYSQRIPLVDKASIKEKYGIVEITLANQVMDTVYKNSPDIILANIDKYTLGNLCFDRNIASVEEYVKPQACSVPTCKPCYDNNDSLINSPCCFTNLTTSAYNVYNSAPPMPSNSMGQGVNTCTYEDNGLRTTFVTCLRNSGTTVSSYDIGHNNDFEVYHAEQCFRCLTNTAPQANHYHFNADVSGTTFLSSIMTYDLQSISQSEENSTDPTSSSMINIDLWAYSPPYPVFCNPTANDGYCYVANWVCYNAISVGNVQPGASGNFYHYVMVDTLYHCEPNGGSTQTANPTPRYGNPALINPFDCSSCPPNPPTRGDKEMPMVVAPGISPIEYGMNQVPLAPGITGASDMSDPCFLNDAGTQNKCGSQGTSYSAPICNGIAACVISADIRMKSWPEKVRAVILATAQNVDFNYWNYQQDGRDGAGVVCGTDAVWLAKNHTTIYGPNNTAVPYGICASSLTSSFQGQSMQFNISVPNPKPSGKHLRVVLTWDSSPSSDGSATNDISDLDLWMYGNSGAYSSFSYESNVEMVDVPSSDLASGQTYVANVHGYTMRIPSNAFAQYIYYAIAWTWVKDQAS